jgi:hypothetical protein
MSWSAEQCRLLDALGYERLEPGRPEARPPEIAAPSRAAPGRSPASQVPAVPRAAAAAPTVTSSPARLLEALRRAANGADPSAWIDDLESLRRDPARKRALWPRLRALRRGH